MMPAPLSVVIPTLDAADELPGTLTSLGAGLTAGLIRELVISDGGSQDATCRIADAAGAVLVEGASGRGGQLRRGVEAARGTWLLLLHADTRLPDGWTEVVLDHLEGNPEQVGYFKLSFRASGVMPRFVAGWANFRSRAFGLPYGDQGLLVRADLLDAVGGVPDIPLMEDVAIARALKPHLRGLPATVVTSATRYEKTGWVCQGARNLWVLLRYFMGIDPKHLARTYRQSGKD